MLRQVQGGGHDFGGDRNKIFGSLSYQIDRDDGGAPELPVTDHVMTPVAARFLARVGGSVVRARARQRPDSLQVGSASPSAQGPQRLSGPQILNRSAKSGYFIFGEFHQAGFGTDANPSAVRSPPPLHDPVPRESQVAHFSEDLYGNTILAPIVFKDVAFQYVAIGPEINASVFLPKQNAVHTTVANHIISHDVISVVVPNGYTIQVIAIHRIVFGQSEFDAPAPE